MWYVLLDCLFFIAMRWNIGFAYLGLLEFSRGWSGEGHDMIGTIVLNNIDESTERFVCSLLGITYPLKPHMRLLGRWADQPPEDLSWTLGQHFANVPFHSCGSFDLARDCSKGCIVSALANYVAVSMNKNESEQDREIAMKMIIHLLGDIHNPVHMGYLEDKGGNNIPLAGFETARYPANLHNVWDFHIPIRFKNTPFVNNIQAPQKDKLVDDWLAQLSTSGNRANLSPSQLRQSLAKLFTDMATETVSYVCQAYRHMSGDEVGKGPWIQSGDGLTPKYMNRMALVAQDRIRKAGVRLAKILKFISSNESSPQSPETPKEGDTNTSVIPSFIIATMYVMLFIN